MGGPARPHSLPPQLATSYDPASVEGPTYRRWMDLGGFDPDPTSGRPPFTIVIPPPNVTGSLHLGHAFQHTLMDALARRRRMQGFDALWLPGMDHAGIATQNVVERELAREGKSRRDWAARRSSRGSGSGRRSTAARSSARCGASGRGWTGAGSASPWTRVSPAPSAPSSSGSSTTDWSTAPSGSPTGAPAA